MKVRHVLTLIFFLLLTSQFMLLPGKAYSECCRCGTQCSVLNIRSWFCTCPGKSPECPYCQANSGVRKSLAISVTELQFTEKFIASRNGGQCLSSNFGLELHANARDRFKFEPIALDENAFRDQNLLFHLMAKEK
jgi:hypothetical protein